MKKVRVRFAPSPTGPLHIGGVRTALYNYLFAKKNNGDFILRIEDTDQTRYVEGAEDYIIESLKWCGIEPNEGQGFGNGQYSPYRQSERKATYKEYADKMIADGTAYYAFDTAEELDALRSKFEAEKRTFAYDSATRMSLNNSLSLSKEETEKKLATGEPYVIRIKINPSERVNFSDIVRGPVSFDTTTMDDKVLFKSDGLPTYHLANVVDDKLMDITHVIRGEEWLPSAPLHVLLYKYLGWENDMPQFAHLPLILKPTGKGKLSKRDGDAGGFPVFPLEWKDPSGETFSGYREKGYFKEAFLNILAFLGWNPGTEQELFSLDELVDAFSLERVGKSGARFDPDKAKWFQEQYLRAKDFSELTDDQKNKISAIVTSEYLKTGNIEQGKLLLDKWNKLSEEKKSKIWSLAKDRISYPHEVITNGKYFIQAPTSYDAQTVKKKWKDQSSQIVNELVQVFNDTAFNATDLEAAFKSYVEKNELGFGVAMIALRLSITGEGGGPSLFDIMEIIGKEESISRMKAAVVNINKETVA